MTANRGDLVVCVDASPTNRLGRTTLQEGKTYKVCRVDFVRGCLIPELDGEPSYWLEGVDPTDCGNGKLARRFRKIDHDKPEACETEFVTLLKRSRVKA